MVPVGSVKRAWLPVAALGLSAVLCGAGSPKDAPSPQRKTTEVTQQAKRKEDASSSAPIHETTKADNGHGKAKSSSEDAAGYQPGKSLVIANITATIVQAVCSIIGLIGLGATVIIALGAWKEAQRSANAAHAAIETTDKIGKAQVRAYLTVTKAWLTIIDRYPFVRIEISNSGQSPARNVWWAYSIRYQGQDTIARGSPDPEMLRLTSGVSIPAGGTVSPRGRLLQFPLSESEAKDFTTLDRAFRAQVIVRVEFEDVFQDWWIEGAAFHFLGNGVSGVERKMQSILDEHASEAG